ncbi:hypothetical protein [Staphylococcus sp. GFQ9D221P]|uniref:hypothetical protein n=1 Tax=Staphylococcus sp. GFQ9D221P TaxID=2804440 RepID=UPI00195238F4|nr:hypothetical protein [Staphylococcus sp. GFQ9D221P]
MKRVAYSVETKYKVVEMKLKGYSTREIMDALNIKICSLKTKLKMYFCILNYLEN